MLSTTHDASVEQGMKSRVIDDYNIALWWLGLGSRVLSSFEDDALVLRQWLLIRPGRNSSSRKPTPYAMDPTRALNSRFTQSLL